jgi:hypothetical protein
MNVARIGGAVGRAGAVAIAGSSIEERIGGAVHGHEPRQSLL